jgi:Spy/CpxP family protein refolding chaperone
MNRCLGRIVTFASLAGTLALSGPGIALAQDAPVPVHQKERHSRHEGLLDEALKLSSLAPEQRTSIEHLQQARRAANVPVRQADARLLTAVAQQVEQANIDRAALEPVVQAKESVAAAAHGVDRDTLQKLHDLLSPAQRGQLVDAVEARGHSHANGGRGGALGRIDRRLGLTAEQEQQILSNLRAEHPSVKPEGKRDRAETRHAWLESFRGESISTVDAPDGYLHGTEHLEDLLQATVPVLTAAQRAQLSNQLRARAAHESRG